MKRHLCFLLALTFISFVSSSSTAQNFENRFLPTSVLYQTETQEGRGLVASETYIAVGKIGFSNIHGTSVGAVEIYSAADFSHMFTIENPFGNNGDEFGFALALDGDLLVVGTPKDGSLDGGEIYVFDLGDPEPTSPILTIPNPDFHSFDEFGRAVAIHNRIIAVGTPLNDRVGSNSGSVYVYDLDASSPASPIYSLHNPNTVGGRSGEEFGFSVSIENNKLLASAPCFDNYPGNAESGIAYLYDFDSATPATPVLTLPSPTMGIGAFGFSLAISNDRALIGDYLAANGGAAYLFDLNAADPTQPISELRSNESVAGDAYGIGVTLNGDRAIVGSGADKLIMVDLTAPVPPNTTGTVVFDPHVDSDLDAFGFRVAISGDNAISSDNLDDELVFRGGATYVFDFDASTPVSPIATLVKRDQKGFDQFGSSIAIEGDLTVIGSPQTNEGLVYVFDKSSPNPDVPSLILSSDDVDDGAEFGSSVALSNGILAVGAILANDVTTNSAGAVFVYDLNSADPVSTELRISVPTSLPNLNARFGSALKFEGSHLFVSAPNINNNRGAVFRYDLDSSEPTIPAATITNPDVPGLGFGSSISISEGILAVGAPGNAIASVSSGIVYVYELSNLTSPLFELVSTNPQNNQWFGNALDMDGHILAVGAPGINLPTSPIGSVEVFDLNSGTPTVPIANLESEFPARNDRYGSAVCVLGNRIFVGIPGEDGAEVDSGSVIVFDLSSVTPTTPTETITSPFPTEIGNFGSTIFCDADGIWIGSTGDSAHLPGAGAVYAYSFAETLYATGLNVTRGEISGGNLAELLESDNVDLSVRRSNTSVNSVVEFALNTTASNNTPDTLTFSIESSAFARGQITQIIEFYNFNIDEYEQVDSRNASRFSDTIVEVEITNDAMRFVHPISGIMSARIRYQSADRRQRFTANIDHVFWVLD